MFTTSNIVLDTILSEGNFYQTWKGKLTQNKSAPLQIVIKKTKGINKYVLLFVHFINRSLLSFKIRNISINKLDILNISEVKITW
jgi:hypothetical protein